MKAVLIGEMARHRISIEDIAKAIKVHRNSVSNKLYGKSEFSVREAIVIADTFFPECDIRVLFEDAKSA